MEAWLNELEACGELVYHKETREGVDMTNIVEEPKLEPHLKYVYLDDNCAKPVIISNNLSTNEENQLMRVLKKKEVVKLVEAGMNCSIADGEWLADKSGRRLLLIVSSSAMALSLLVVSISFYLKEYISPDSDLYATLSLVSVAGVVVMVIAFSLGLGAMPWIIMSKILPINIKGLAGSFATLANWFFSWLVTLTANLLLDWSSGGLCALPMLIFYKYLLFLTRSFLCF
ncbi:sugar transporter ERD6-like 6 [Lathyrus oleraceus]|uniref:sugar transporter ERD6-like 6 n=1 Tax=Pisum sativum TaxID=3888 RepID=UPI0021D12797|nr:sugar transporter ERD6-like 6 [Pisum sativum]